jgi:hypothetical protein
VSRTSDTVVDPGNLGSTISKALTTENTTAIKDGGGLDRKFSVSPALVKGTRAPGQKELEDPDEIMKRQRNLESTFLASIRKSETDPLGVCKSLSPLFGAPLGQMIERSPWYQMGEWAKSIDKSFTTTSPLGSGLVPFDLVAPTLLTYPVFTPLRNRLPRPQGQGLSHRAKVMTAVTGSRPGLYGNSAQRVSITELPGGGSLSGTNWPNQIPGSGSQTLIDMDIPYKFFGLTEAATWLSQFAGQGFDDIAALASLVLLQEFMMAEERSIIGATTKNLATPTAPALTVRSTTTNPLTTVTGSHVWIYVTALNYYGETTAVTTARATVSATHVVDVTLPSNATGRLVHNIYVAVGTSSPGIGGAFLMVKATGAHLVTLTGKVPHSGPTPPTVDTGTGSTNDYEGMFSILSGKASTDGIYPSGYQAGYYNGAAGTTLGVTILATALQQVYNGSTSSYFADPSELWCEASDAKRLSLALKQDNGSINYTLFIDQNEVNNVTAGTAVSQFANPVTRSTVRITVHPYWPQGSAAGVSYTLPQTQTNVSNVWENVCVQDYISINWPVIDVTFRYSLFLYATLFCPAPQYNFLLQGLQKSATTPYS